LLLLLSEPRYGLRRDERQLDDLLAVAALPIVLDDLPTHRGRPEAFEMVDRAVDRPLRVLAVVEIRCDLVRHSHQLVHVHSRCNVSVSRPLPPNPRAPCAETRAAAR